MRYAILALTLLAPAAVAQAADPKAATSDDQKIVCKSERFVGSNLRERICKTKAEWDNARRSSKDMLDRDRGLRIDKPVPGAAG
jgi:hypothetical protein